MPASTSVAPPDAVFRALGDPMRRAMLERLQAGERSASELGEGLPISQPGASQHIRVLRDAGLVEGRREGRQRLYRLVPGPLKAVHDWTAHYSAFWENQLDDLASDLDAAVPSVGGSDAG